MLTTVYKDVITRVGASVRLGHPDDVGVGRRTIRSNCNLVLGRDPEQIRPFSLSWDSNVPSPG